MSVSYYFDTSALLKLYHKENGSDKVDTFFLEAQAPLFISRLAEVELKSALYRRVRMGDITDKALIAASDSFTRDCQIRIQVKDLSAIHYAKAVALLAKYGKTKALRTLDALQLAVHLVENQAAVFVCADTALLDVARLESCSVSDVS